MKTILAVALACCFSVPAFAQELRQGTTLAASKQMYQVVNQMYKDKSSPDFVTFENVLGAGWIAAHKQEAMEKAAKKGIPQASPDDVWELPYANDWLGCMSMQIPSEQTLIDAKFSTFAQHQFLPGWLQDNKEALHKTAELTVLYDFLFNIDVVAVKCEDLIRKQPPQGAIDV